MENMLKNALYACPHDDEFEDEDNMFGLGASFEGVSSSTCQCKIIFALKLHMKLFCLVA
jgi:hypothetical protein